MKNIIVLLLLAFSISASAQTFTITRFDQVGSDLIISLSSKSTTSYINHVFTESEKTDTTTIKATIATLAAKLGQIDSLYAPTPIVVVDKIRRAKKFQIDPNLIKSERRRIDKLIKNDTIKLNYDDQTVF